MKYKFCFITLLFSITTLSMHTAAAHLKSQYHTVISCKMINGDKIILKVLRPVDGDKPYLEINSKIQLAFDKDVTYGFVTDLALVRCIRHTLIVVMEFGSPYPRGLAIRQNPITHKYERIDFGQKSLPTALYFKHNEWGVILPNIENGYYVGKKYLVHFYKSGKNQPEQQNNMKGTNKFPIPKKDLIHIPLPKELQ